MAEAEGEKRGREGMREGGPPSFTLLLLLSALPFLSFHLSRHTHEREAPATSVGEKEMEGVLN